MILLSKVKPYFDQPLHTNIQIQIPYDYSVFIFLLKPNIYIPTIHEIFYLNKNLKFNLNLIRENF